MQPRRKAGNQGSRTRRRPAFAVLSVALGGDHAYGVFQRADDGGQALPRRTSRGG